jgi:acylphosphatase
MRLKATSVFRLAWLLAAVGGLALIASSGGAAEANLKLEALLIWGTNDTHSSDPAHKPVTPEVKKKLQELPFKWTSYYVINRKVVEVPPKGLSKVAISDKCDIEVKNLGNTTVEVSLFGRREHVLKRTQALPKGETLVLGGNAPNSTSWFVVLAQTEAAVTPDPPQTNSASK